MLMPSAGSSPSFPRPAIVEARRLERFELVAPPFLAAAILSLARSRVRPHTKRLSASSGLQAVSIEEG